jgi:hypothetical protein
VADLRRLAVLGLAAAAMLPALIAGRVLIPGDGPPLRDAALLSPFALLAIGAFVATLSSLTGRSRTAA